MHLRNDQARGSFKRWNLYTPSSLRIGWSRDSNGVDSCKKNAYYSERIVLSMIRGPCQHGMARLHVADEGTASNMEDILENIQFQSLTADKGWYSNSGVGWGANNSSPWKPIMLRTVHKVPGPGQILWYDLRNGQVHTGFWWANPREGDNSEDVGVGGRIILR